MINFAKDRWKEFNSIIDDENLTSREKLLLLIIFRYVNHITGYASPSRNLSELTLHLRGGSFLGNTL